MDKETRVFNLTTIEVREGDGAAAPTIDGYGAVYDSPSEDLGGFVEIIERGFFDGALGDDVVSLWNHNDDKPLGRTTAGTLAISSDEHGLHTRTSPPDTTWGRDALVSIRRGDVRHMSFAFRTRFDGDKWEKRDDGTIVRRLLPGGCARLYDVSPVTFPAYPATQVSARALDKIKELSGQGAGDGLEPADEGAAAGAARRRTRQLELKKRGI